MNNISNRWKAESKVSSFWGLQIKNISVLMQAEESEEASVWVQKSKTWKVGENIMWFACLSQRQSVTETASLQKAHGVSVSSRTSVWPKACESNNLLCLQAKVNIS